MVVLMSHTSPRTAVSHGAIVRMCVVLFAAPYSPNPLTTGVLTIPHPLPPRQHLVVSCAAAIGAAESVSEEADRDPPGSLGRVCVVEDRVRVVERVARTLVRLEPGLRRTPDCRFDLLDRLDRNERVCQAEVMQARPGDVVGEMQQIGQSRAVVGNQRVRGVLGRDVEREPATEAEAQQAEPSGDLDQPPHMFQGRDTVTYRARPVQPPNQRHCLLQRLRTVVDPKIMTLTPVDLRRTDDVAELRQVAAATLDVVGHAEDLLEDDYGRSGPRRGMPQPGGHDPVVAGDVDGLQGTAVMVKTYLADSGSLRYLD